MGIRIPSSSGAGTFFAGRISGGCGFRKNSGVPQARRLVYYVYFEHPNLNWMLNRGTPISGKLVGGLATPLKNDGFRQLGG